MPRIIYLFVMMIMTLILAACSNKPDGSADPGAEEAAMAENGSDAADDQSGAGDEVAGEDEVLPEARALNDGEGIAPDLDISGCDTFTQIVDRKLEDGMGYDNVRIGEEDVLLVSSGCFDNDGNGQMAAIDSTIYMYTDDSIVMIGKVTCGGTAYPLCVKDGYLICGANHWISKSTIKDGKLLLVDESWAEFSEDGEDAYYHYDVEKDEVSVVSEEEFWKSFDILEDAELIEYAVVHRD
ncbi:hypothetical protein [Butyrivibrio sp. MC2013]|uniref:hypothetical protein n=1 Tax=Butyrivibrio sp. MC2013 TaxID=1280686 RepID=UPI00040786BB|nr:hypothetical protein [Butyrivibrio sp. MC2013]